MDLARGGIRAKVPHNLQRAIPMSKTTTQIEINHDSQGKVTFTQNGQRLGPLEITSDNNLEIKLGNGFNTRGAQVLSMDLYTDLSGSKGSSIGTWQRTKPADQPSGDMAVSADGTSILVTDTNATGADDCYFFAVTATDGTQTYSSDPELKVKKTTN